MALPGEMIPNGYKSILFVLISGFLLIGCRAVPQFPNRPMRVQIDSDGSKIKAFDTNNDRQADYWQRENLSGRKVELRFGASDDQSGETVLLDQIDPCQIMHFIIALDGVPYQLVQELYGQGHFHLRLVYSTFVRFSFQI